MKEVPKSAVQLVLGWTAFPPLPEVAVHQEGGAPLTNPHVPPFCIPILSCVHWAAEENTENESTGIVFSLCIWKSATPFLTP